MDLKSSPIFFLLITDVQVFSQEELHSEANSYKYREKMQNTQNPYSKSLQMKRQYEMAYFYLRCFVTYSQT